MKKSDLTFAALSVPVDFLMILAAAYAAYFLRFQVLIGLRPIFFEIPLSRYTTYAFGAAFFFICIFAFSGLYAIGYHRIRNEAQKIITACSTSIMLILVGVFFIQEIFGSRFIVLAAWMLSIVFVLCGRLALRMLRSLLYRAGWGLHNVVLIGNRQRTARCEKEFHARRKNGYNVLFCFEHFDDDVKAQLSKATKNHLFEEIIVVNPTISREELHAIIDFSDIYHIGIRYSADIIDGKRLEIGTLAGFPMVEIKRTRLDGWGKIIKRSIDIVLSGIGIILFLPIMALIGFCIFLESNGPIIYRNIRVGHRGNFVVYKFRSMYRHYCVGLPENPPKEAEKLELLLAEKQSVRKGPVFKILNDPRRTRVGRFLERTSLDELPQLFNVFLGSMSLVGPRPHIPVQVAKYQNHHHQLFFVKPGITGLAQISGRSDLDFEDEARLDIFYIENWSFVLDCIILFKTPLVVLLRSFRAEKV